MFGLEKRYMTCPECEQFFKRPHRVCPFCGHRFEPEPTDDVGMFSARERALFIDERKMERKPISHEQAEAELFRSHRRSAENEGYTQQNTELREKTYYGVSADAINNMDDGTYFRSRARTADKETTIRRVTTMNDGVFFSSQRRSESAHAVSAESRDKDTEEHRPEVNPYLDKSVMNDEPVITEHSVEYKAHNIKEFARHRFGKAYADRLEFILAGIVFSALLCLAFEHFFVAIYVPQTADIATYIMVAAVAALSIPSVKSWNKYTAMVLSWVVIVYSVFMLIYIFVHAVIGSIRNFDVLTVFIPDAAMCVLCLRLTVYMSNFHNQWDAYGKKGSELVETAPPEDIEFFRSKTKEDANPEEREGTEQAEDA